MDSLTSVTQIPIWGLWPEALSIATSGAFLTAMNVYRPVTALSSSRVRTVSCLGLVSCLYLFYLGVWPSIFSFAAIFEAPAAVAFGFFLVRPSHFSNWPKLRIYLTICVALSSFCATTELLWLVHLRR